MSPNRLSYRLLLRDAARIVHRHFGGQSNQRSTPAPSSASGRPELADPLLLFNFDTAAILLIASEPGLRTKGIALTFAASPQLSPLSASAFSTTPPGPAPALEPLRQSCRSIAALMIRRLPRAHCHRQWETDPPGTLNLTHRVRWFLREGGADAEGGGADGISGFEKARW